MNVFNRLFTIIFFLSKALCQKVSLLSICPFEASSVYFCQQMVKNRRKSKFGVAKYACAGCILCSVVIIVSEFSITCLHYNLCIFFKYSMLYCVARWTEINWLLVGFGQQTCLPVGPKCGDCLNR